MTSYFQRVSQEKVNTIKRVHSLALSYFGKEDVELALSQTTQKRVYLDIRYVMVYVMVEEYQVPYNLIGYHYTRVVFNKKIKDGNYHYFARHAHLTVRDKLYDSDKVLRTTIEEFRDYCRKHIEQDYDVKDYNILAQKWHHMNMYEEFKHITMQMESKVNDLSGLIKELEDNGHRVERNPDMVFIPSGLEEEDIPIEMIILRNKYGFIIQTEIR